MAITRQQFDVFDRQIQLRPFGVFQQDTFVGRAQRFDDFQTHITADAVIDVNDQIAWGQALGFGQEIFRFAFLFRLADQTVAQHVLFRNDRQVVGFKPFFQRPYGQMDARFTNARVVFDGDNLAQSFVL